MPFPQWKKENIPFCVGDVGLFYDLPKSVFFEVARPKAKNLAHIFFTHGEKRKLLSWKELEPLYLRSPV